MYSVKRVICRDVNTLEESRRCKYQFTTIQYSRLHLSDSRVTRLLPSEWHTSDGTGSVTLRMGESYVMDYRCDPDNSLVTGIFNQLHHGGIYPYFTGSGGNYGFSEAYPGETSSMSLSP